MNVQNQAFNRRWDKLESAKRQTRKVAYTLIAVALTSLFVAVA